MNSEDMNPTAMRLFVWAGVVLVTMLIIAQHLVMGFVPPPSPQLTPEQIKQVFVDGQNRILVGCTLQIITWSFYGIWATPIVMFIRKTERSWPMFTYASLINIGCCSVFFILVPLTWATIAFRAPAMDPQLVQFVNDWVWFDWLYTWPPYSVWMFILSAAILLDRSSPTVYPRWVGYFNLWAGILIIPACTIGFFKFGPFAYDGIVSFWLASVVFFGWMVVMSVTTYRAIGNEERSRSSAPSAVAMTPGNLAMNA